MFLAVPEDILPIHPFIIDGKKYKRIRNAIDNYDYKRHRTLYYSDIFEEYIVAYHRDDWGDFEGID